MRAKLLDLPPVVTGQERAEDFCDRLEQLLLEAGEAFPRADLRRRAAACVRGLLGPLSRKNGWQISEPSHSNPPRLNSLPIKSFRRTPRTMTFRRVSRPATTTSTTA